MKKINFTCIIFTLNCLLNACGLSLKSSVDNLQTIKQDKTTIEDLSDGNYRFCSEPNPYPYEDKVDVHRYCFTFTKKDYRIIGKYSYRAPKDTPNICIDGTIKNNLITGVGYEEISPGSQPLTEEEFSNLEELPSSEQLEYWDDVEHYQGGLNLKIGNPSWYKLSTAIESEYESYWVTQSYEIVEFDLSNFEQIKVNNLPRFAKCTS